MRDRYKWLLFIFFFTGLLCDKGFASITLLAPPNDTTFASSSDLKNVTFRWTKENTSSQVQYIIEADTVNTFKSPVFIFPIPTIGDTSFQFPSQFSLNLPPRDYYWRIMVQGQQTDSSAPFKFTIAQAAKEPPVIFYHLPGGTQNVYASFKNISYSEDGPFLFTIGASDTKGISRVEARIYLHRGSIVDSMTMPLDPLSQSTDFPGTLYGNYWYPSVSLIPGDIVTYGFTGYDTLGFDTWLDSSIFKISISAPDTATTYSRTLVPACQYVFELTDTNGRQIDSTRKATRPDNEAAGLVHKYNTFCGPSAGASCFQWLGQGKVDSAFVDSLAEAFKTNVNPSDGSFPGNVANGAIARLRGRYTVNLWQDTTNVFTSPTLDTGIRFHDAPPHFTDYSKELTDSEDVIISIGWWQDSAGVKMVRRGGHFITGKGFRTDGHFVTGAAVNDSNQMIEVMDPDCGRFRWIHWGGAGPNTQGMDSLDYSGLSAGMTALVESMVSISKVGKAGTGVGEATVPSSFFTMQNVPNPFSATTRLIVQSSMLDHAENTYSLKVYDVLGREAADLTNALHFTGNGIAEAEFNGSGLPAGLYYYTFTMGSFSQSKPMLMIR
ncbi:MAG TPA: T9SS type A sorting domain-containing protein [Candidatus Kapabacteria bacterium]|nr:T9SS type A sorting domain-containing protein [Candidatus Kapabacteria bacterium]